MLTFLRDTDAPRTRFSRASRIDPSHTSSFWQAPCTHAPLSRSNARSGLWLSNTRRYPRLRERIRRFALYSRTRPGGDGGRSVYMNTAEPEAGRERTSGAASTQLPPRKLACPATASWRALQQRLPSPSPSSLSTSILVASTPSLSSSATSSSCSSVSSAIALGIIQY